MATELLARIAAKGMCDFAPQVPIRSVCSALVLEQRQDGLQHAPIRSETNGPLAAPTNRDNPSILQQGTELVPQERRLNDQSRLRLQCLEIASSHSNENPDVLIVHLH